MYVHAEDPNKVNIEDFATGYSISDTFGEVSFKTYANYSGITDGYLGTLADGNITMPTQGLVVFLSLYNGAWYGNNSGAFLIRLPGAKDYSLSLEAPSCTADNHIPFTLATGTDIAAVKYLLLPPGTYEYDTPLYQSAMGRGETLAQEDLAAGTFTLDLSQEEPGRYTLVVAAMNADGQYVAGEGTYFWVTSDDNDNWKSLGYTTYTEDILGGLYNYDNYSYRVEIQEHISTPGYFRLVNPYADPCPFAAYNLHATDHNHYIYIHAEQPDAVWLEESPFGIDWGHGGMSVNSLPNYNAGFQTADFYGTLSSDGAITFPVRSLIFCEQQEGHGTAYYTNRNGAFKVIIPVTSAIRSAQSDAPAAPSLYDLSGRKVQRPAHGIYIKDGKKVIR